jgi:hypothetical protein
LQVTGGRVTRIGGSAGASPYHSLNFQTGINRMVYFLAAVVGLIGWLAMAPAAWGQSRPYIGLVYPAGGQQGTTFQIRVGGQNLDDVNAVLVTGSGVTARVVEVYRRLNNQEVQLLNEQLRDLKKATTAVASAMAPMMKADTMMMASENTMMMSATNTEKTRTAPLEKAAALLLTTNIEKRTREFVSTPACAALSSLVMVEFTVSPEAEAGAREIRLAGPRGVSNPMAFHVGQVPEHARKPMTSATLQVLGKEAQSLRKRPVGEVEDRITLPCTVNGQIASGEVNRYRFEARQGQKLVLSTLARQLIPFIADAVPGWFQPVLVLYDANGKEVAYDDDYRFKPDPVIFYEVPRDGEYVFAIHDSLFRGREDFVYRITVGELPFVTSIFPLGARLGEAPSIKMKGWNLQEAALTPPVQGGGTGIQELAAKRKGLVSNRVPFALDALPECLEKEPNDTPANAQEVTLPIMINGRMDKPDDWDLFQFAGKSNDTIVAEVQARRLDSPMDSVLKLTDATGRLLAFNDDREDVGAGANTHHADSWLMATLPADGRYCIHLGDTARQSGEENAYRLRLSAARPDFALRVVPSSISLRTNSTATLTIYAQRKDGFAGPIKLALTDPPAGFSAAPVIVAGTQAVARLTIKGPVAPTKEPLNLSVVGSAKIGEKEISHEAVPAEDRMQAFLWRHLVPASDLKVVVFDPGYQPPPKRVAPVRPVAAVSTNAVASAKTAPPTNATLVTKVPALTNALATTNLAGTTNRVATTNAAVAAKPKFTKQQIAGRLKELKKLFEEGLLTEAFYCERVAECETAQ